MGTRTGQTPHVHTWVLYLPLKLSKGVRLSPRVTLFADSAERRRRMRRAIQSSFWMHSLEPEVPKGEPIQPALTILDRRTTSHECKGAIISPTTAREQSIRKSGR